MLRVLPRQRAAMPFHAAARSARLLGMSIAESLESLELPEPGALVEKLDQAVGSLDLDDHLANFVENTADFVERLPEQLASLGERSLLAGLLPRPRALVEKVLALSAQPSGANALRTPAGAEEPAGSWNLAAVTASLLGVGPLHFLAPKPFDAIVPPGLPGPARLWTYLSGLAEILIGLLLVVPRTRRLGGLAAASLFAAVYPANVQMAKDAEHKGPLAKALAYGRLPLQFPLIFGALKIGLTGR